MLDDNSLLEKCRHGDKAALDQLLRLYQQPIYRLALRVTGNETIAQDATANALVKIWTKAHQWRGESGAGTWIYRLAFRAILDTQRSQKRWWQRWIAGLSRTVSDGQLAPDEAAIDNENRETLETRIQEAIGHLSEEDRALVHLYYFEDRGLKEIEEIIGASHAALKMRLSRARKRLREFLEDLGEET